MQDSILGANEKECRDFTTRSYFIVHQISLINQARENHCGKYRITKAIKIGCYWKFNWISKLSEREFASQNAKRGVTEFRMVRALASWDAFKSRVWSVWINYNSTFLPFRAEIEFLQVLESEYCAESFARLRGVGFSLLEFRSMSGFAFWERRKLSLGTKK